MKKLAALMTAGALAAALAAPAMAAEFQTAGDLWDHWNGAYPDYVCGVWSTDGGGDDLTIAVTENAAGEAGKGEILDLIEDDGTVTFVYRTYPYAQLLEAREALAGYLEADVGIGAIGIDEEENCVWIDIDSENPMASAVMEEISAHYGDLVAFHAVPGLTAAPEEGPDGAAEDAPEGQLAWWTWPVGTVALMALVWLWITRCWLAQPEEGPVPPEQTGKAAEGDAKEPRTAPEDTAKKTEK